MNLIRKLLSHGFLIFTLVVLAAAYYYRAQLFPGLVHKGENAEQASDGTPKSGEMVVESYGKVAPGAAQPQENPSDQPPQYRAEEKTPSGPGTPAPTGTFTNPGAPPAEGDASGEPQFRATGEETSGTGEPKWDRPLPNASGTPPQPLPPIPEAPMPANAANPPMPSPPPTQAMPQPAPGGGQLMPPAPVGQPVPQMAPGPMTAGQPMPPAGGPSMPPEAAAPGIPPMPQFAPPEAMVPPGPPMGPGGRDAYGPVYGAVRTPPTGSPVTNPDQISLNQARQMYWSGDIDGAKKAYGALAERISDNPDIYGELGNLNYAQGDLETAAEDYYQAGTRLVQQGRIAQAMHLLSIVRGLSAEKAQAFETFLKQQGRDDLLR